MTNLFSSVPILDEGSTVFKSESLLEVCLNNFKQVFTTVVLLVVFLVILRVMLNG